MQVFNLNCSSLDFVGQILSRASSEDYLEDSESSPAHPSWSRAVGRCTKLIHLNIYCTTDTVLAKENDTLRLGLVPPSRRERKVFISHSELNYLTQIEEGIMTNITIQNQGLMYSSIHYSHDQNSH